MPRAIAFLSIILVVSRLGWVDCEPQAPCVFVFGDSLSDSGNNNLLSTKAKAGYKPYGIDFPGGNPTGRFTNGRTAIDVITDLLGFDKYIPSYKKDMGAEANQGVNYASGAAGILPETGSVLGDRISLDQQIENHKSIVTRNTALGKKKCIYLVNIGSNDYLNNYYAKGYKSKQKYPNSKKYAEYLVEQYSNSLKALIKLGARKVAVFGLGQVGCALFEIKLYGATKGTPCVGYVNDAVDQFNVKLVSLVDGLNRNYKVATVTFINTSSVSVTPSEGFKVFDTPCCKPQSDGLCEPNSTPCSDRNGHVFWDMFHPTQAVNVLVGKTAYKAQNSNNAHPMDISELAKASK